MNTKLILVSVVLLLTVSIVSADEPTALTGVKTFVLHGDSSVLGDPDRIPATAGPALGSLCIAAIDARLTAAALAVQNKAEGADAELVGQMVFRPTGLSGVEVSYSIRISSIPSGRSLLSFVGVEDGDNPTEACDAMAEKIVKKVLKARAGPTK